MSIIFTQPKRAISAVKFKYKAPWRKKNQVFEPLPESVDDLFTSGETADAHAKSVKTKLSLAQIFQLPINLTGWVIFIGGMVCIGSVFPGKHSHKSNPLINDSIVASIVVGLICFVIAVWVWKAVEKIKVYRNEAFKREIVKRRLQSCFNVTDYAYNELEEGRLILVSFLESLQIRNGGWNRFSYNDYFRGTYKNAPLSFLTARC